MLVKRYVVKEMPEAVALIREDLGKDAVILSTKKIQSRGFLGLFSKTQIEVIAAANEQGTKKPERAPARGVPHNAAVGAYQQTRTPSAPARATEEEQQPIVPPVSRLESAPAIAIKTAPVQVQAPPPVAQLEKTLPTVRAVEFPKVGAETPKTEYVRSADSVATQPLVNADGKDDLELVREVQELRSLIRSFLISPANSMIPEPVRQVRLQLLENDLEEEVVERLIEKGIRHFQQVQSITEQEFRGVLTNLIKEELERVAQPVPLTFTTRVASFIGPTGVGKTTTIAKLAAEQVLTRGKKLGLITTDTYRISAVEQLRTYANILNVPLEVCYSPEDAHRALQKMSDCDLILVDTAGRNYSNTLNVGELNTYLQVLKPDETYLVLSLTTKASDLAKIVSNFAQVPISKFLFTKADETKTYGAIYNLVSRFQIPLSYMTTGQNVPDDIEVVSIGRLASLLVGEKSNV